MFQLMKNSVILVFFSFLTITTQAQLRLGFNGGITYSKALNTEDVPYINNGTYEHLALLSDNFNCFVNYQFKDWMVELQFGEKRLGFKANKVQYFTPNRTTAPGYRHPGIHPVYHFNKYRYNYYNINLRLKRFFAPDFQVFIGINPMIHRIKFTSRRNDIKVPNPGEVIRYRWRIFGLDDIRKLNWLLNSGLNYRIAKNFSLEVSYMLSLNPLNLETERGKLYHNGFSTLLVVDFEVRKPKFLSKKP